MGRDIQMSQKERINYFDNIKGIMILFVVLGHFLDVVTLTSDFAQSIFMFIYAVHMPMFFVISGYFHSNKNIANKVYFYLVMGLATKALIFFTRKYLLGADTTLRFLTEAGTPWFMYAMAAFILVTYLLRTVDIRVLFGIGIIIGCLAGYDDTLKDYLVLSRFFVFFPFYALGILLKKYANLEKLRQNKILKILSPATILCWLAICIVFLECVAPFRKLFTARHPFWGEIVYQYGFVLRLICYAVSISLSLAYLLSVTNKKTLLTTVGNRSLQIFFLHRPILYVLAYFKLHDICTTPWGIAVYILIALVLGLILSLKVFSYPTDILRKLCFMNTEKTAKEN